MTKMAVVTSGILSRTSGRQAACAAGRLHGTYWLIGPGSAWLEAAAARFRCRPGSEHIVAAARLQLVYFI